MATRTPKQSSFVTSQKPSPRKGTHNVTVNSGLAQALSKPRISHAKDNTFKIGRDEQLHAIEASRQKIVTPIARNVVREEVRNLPTDIIGVPSAHGRQMIAALVLDRKNRHETALEEHNEQLKHLNAELEVRLKESVSQVKVFLSASDKEIDELFTELDDSSLVCVDRFVLDGVWDQAQQHEKYRMERIGELSGDLEALEQERKTVVDSLLRTLGYQLVEIAHLLAPEVERLLADEVQAVDVKISDNRQSYAELVARLRLHELEKFKSLDEKWREREEAWRRHRHHAAIVRAKTQLNSTEFTDPPGRKQLFTELKQEQIRVHGQRMEQLQILSSLKPVDMHKETVQALRESIDQVNETAQDAYDKVFDRMRREQSRIDTEACWIAETLKDELLGYSSLPADEATQAINQILAEEVLPLVQKRTEEGLKLLAKCGKFLESGDTATHNLCCTIIAFFTEVAEMLDNHESKLQRMKTEYVCEIDATLETFDLDHAKEESELKSIQDQIRWSIDEETLMVSQQRAFAQLDSISAGYRSIHSSICALVERYPQQIDSRFIDDLTLLGQRFGLVHPNAPKQTVTPAVPEASSPAPVINTPATVATSKTKEPVVSKDKAVVAAAATVPVPEPTTQRREFLNPGYRSVKGTSYVVTTPLETIAQTMIQSSKPAPPAPAEPVEANPLESIGEQAAGADVASAVTPTPSGEPSKADPTTPSSSKRPLAKGPVKQETAKGKGKAEMKNQAAKAPPPPSEEEIRQQQELKRLQEEAKRRKEEEERFPTDGEGIPCVEVLEINTEQLTGMLSSCCNGCIGWMEDKWEDEADSARIDRLGRLDEGTNTLDERLRQHWPRKGRIEVDLCQPRAAEIHNHRQRYERHVRSILTKDETHTSQFEQERAAVLANIDSFLVNQKLLRSNLVAASSLSVLQTLSRQCKEAVTTFQEQARVSLQSLLHLAVACPDALRDANEEFLRSCRVVEDGGNYSGAEVQWYEGQLQAIHDLLAAHSEARKGLLEQLETQVRETVTKPAETFEAAYADMLDQLAAREGLGKKYGAPRRTAQERMRRELTICENAFLGIKGLAGTLRGLLDQSESSNLPLALKLRRVVCSLRRCSLRYALHLECLKQPSAIVVLPVSRDEWTEEVKSEDVSAAVVEEELEPLGLLAAQDVGLTFQAAALQIEEEARQETFKLYGINTTSGKGSDKAELPEFMTSYLESLRTQVQSFRESSARELRKLVQDIQELLRTVPGVVFENIMHRCQHTVSANAASILAAFERLHEQLEQQRLQHRTSLRPGLANPNNSGQLQELCQLETQRGEASIQLIKDTLTQLTLCHNDQVNLFSNGILNASLALFTAADAMLAASDFIKLPGDEDVDVPRKSVKHLLRTTHSPDPVHAATATSTSAPVAAQKAAAAKDSKSAAGKGSTQLPTNTLLLNINSVVTGPTADRFPKRSWPGLPMSDLRAVFVPAQQQVSPAVTAPAAVSAAPSAVAGSGPTSAAVSPSITSYSTPVHKQVAIQRQAVWQSYKQYLDVAMTEIKTTFTEHEEAELLWQKNWLQMLTYLKDDAS
eukprot:GILJ01008252.1.p1 GENE.GILJ01008252.1~~GILJ01008252.1.p1  ORF type:complete len:1559 (+),score=335.92 GILJ01008252.1:44-4720(+)